MSVSGLYALGLVSLLSGTHKRRGGVRAPFSKISSSMTKGAYDGFSRASIGMLDVHAENSVTISEMNEISSRYHILSSETVGYEDNLRPSSRIANFG